MSQHRRPRRTARKPFPPAARSRREAVRSDAPRRESRAAEGGAPAAPAAERLQKVLAAAGLGSRRDCEELIVAGRVEVDRQVITELGTRVDPLRQEIRVDGDLLPRPRRVHYLVNKPVGVLSTHRDPAGRPRVVDLVESDQRLFTVGRLDRSSEGLILVTNDGELANRLAHPRYEVEKKYQVEVAGLIGHEELRRLRRGVHLAEAFVRPTEIVVRRRKKQSSLLEITLREGRNREIRRMLARTGHKVLRLKRVALGPLNLGDLPVGAYRPLTPEELRDLRRAAAGQGARGKPPHRPRRTMPGEAAAEGHLAPHRPRAAGQLAGEPPAKGGRAALSRKPRPSRVPAGEGGGQTRSARGRKPSTRGGAGKPPSGKPPSTKPAAGKSFSRKPFAGSPRAGKPLAEKPTGKIIGGEPARGRRQEEGGPFPPGKKSRHPSLPPSKAVGKNFKKKRR